MAKSMAQETSPGLAAKKGPSARPPPMPSSQQGGDSTTDDDATICGLEDTRQAVDLELDSGPMHALHSVPDKRNPSVNGSTPAKAQHMPPSYPPPPPIAPPTTPPLLVPHGLPKSHPRSPSPPLRPTPVTVPSPPPAASNGSTSLSSHSPTPKRSSSSPCPPPHHPAPRSPLPPSPPVRTPPPPKEADPVNNTHSNTTDNRTISRKPGRDARGNITPNGSVPKPPKPTAGLGVIPPPPRPKSSPPPPSSASGGGPFHVDEQVIHTPVPRGPAKPFGRLKTEMEWYRRSRRAPGSSDEDEAMSTVFPPTYPALSRAGSRSRSKTKYDVASEIASTMMQLQGRNPQEEKLPGRIAAGNVQDLWSNLRKKRDDIYALRLDMTRDRKALRELRHRKNDADNKMLSIVRRVLPRLGNEHRRSFADTQALRTEYTTHETSYENRELALDDLEAELVLLETKFFSGLSQRAGADEEPDKRRAAPSTTPEPADHVEGPLELRGISQDGPPENIHPLYERFQDAVGEFGLATESWHDLLGARAEIDFKLTINKHLEMERLDEEELEFLAEYSEEEVRRSKELQEARWKVENLRKRCAERGVMRKRVPFHMVYVLGKHFPTEDDDEDDLGEDIDLGDGTPSKSARQARPFLSRLMSQKAHLLGDFPVLPGEALGAAEALDPEYAGRQTKLRDAREEVFLHRIFADCPEHDASAFVDRWLFHQLRISTHMAHLVCNLVAGESRGRCSGVGLQEYVLASWWDDDARPARGVDGSTRAHDGERGGSGSGSGSGSGKGDGEGEGEGGGWGGGEDNGEVPTSSAEDLVVEVGC